MKYLREFNNFLHLHESTKIGQAQTKLKIHFDINLTKHGKERETRTDNEGDKIDNKEIVQLINKLSREISNALINDEVFINDKKSQLLLKDRRSDLPTTNMNVVISVEGDILSKNPLQITVITVMRKGDFKQFGHKSNEITIKSNGDVKHTKYGRK